MTSRNWFHLWMRLADRLALRVCNFVEASDRSDDRREPCFADASDTRWHIERAQHWARMRRRAIRRADEALARASMLRVDGGAR